MTISELDERGQQFLINLFEQTDGDTSVQVSMYELGESLGLDRDAAEIASASKGDGADIAEPLVDSKINTLQVEANASVIRTLDDVLGTLFDDKA